MPMREFSYAAAAIASSAARCLCASMPRRPALCRYGDPNPIPMRAQIFAG